MQNALNILGSFWSQFVSGIIGLIVGYVLSRLRERFKRWRRSRSAVEFFGLDSGKTTMVHSAVFDEPRGAYNLPECDTTAARHVASIFQRCGLCEDYDYMVAPDVDLLRPDGSFPPEVLQGNLVLICSPKRNQLTKKFFEAAHGLRYQMRFGESSSEIQIYDTTRRTSPMVSSREQLIAGKIKGEDASGYDFALVMSLPNPYNQERRVVVLAGIHGTGTLGAAKFIADENNLRLLVNRKDQGIVQEVVKVKFSGDYENVTDVVLT